MEKFQRIRGWAIMACGIIAGIFLFAKGYPLSCFLMMAAGVLFCPKIMEKLSGWKQYLVALAAIALAFFAASFTDVFHSSTNQFNTNGGASNVVDAFGPSEKADNPEKVDKDEIVLPEEVSQSVEEQSDTKKTYAIGETANLNQGDNGKYSVVITDWGTKPSVYDGPILYIAFTAQNTGETGVAVGSDMFTLYADDYAVEQYGGAVGEDSKFVRTFELSSGRKVDGEIYAEIDPESISTLEVELDNCVFVLKSPDLDSGSDKGSVKGDSESTAETPQGDNAFDPQWYMTAPAFLSADGNVLEFGFRDDGTIELILNGVVEYHTAENKYFVENSGSYVYDLGNGDMMWYLPPDQIELYGYGMFYPMDSAAPDGSENGGVQLTDPGAFGGEWYDIHTQQAKMEIICNNDVDYSVSIEWPQDSWTSTFWYFTANYDTEQGCLVYNDGVCYDEYYTYAGGPGDGSEPIVERKDVYSNGQGVISIRNGWLYWNDYTGHAADDWVFEGGF